MPPTTVLTELFSVEGKVVLVTGGTRGIGLAIAEAFVQAGARVYICSRKEEACRAASDALSQHGVCHALPANVATGEGRAALAQALGRSEQRLDVLVNNAGALWAEPLEEYPESGWDKVYDLNVKGTFFLVQELLPLLRAAATPASPARIINVGSINGFHVPKHETYAYASSKAAVHHLSRHLAWRLAGESVTVNVIAPGRFNSDMLAGTVEQRGEEAMLDPIPLGRFAGAPDMAGAAIYLASVAGAYVTGAILPVDGGMATTL